jgi:predicted transcriptional regulator
MKAKMITIGVKDTRTAVDEFVAAGEALVRGQTVSKETGVYFASVEAFRKAMTPKRLQLLHLIKTTRPASVNQLARIANRNIKNVAEDLRFLVQVGLVETKKVDRCLAPRVEYDEISLKIAV